MPLQQLIPSHPHYKTSMAIHFISDGTAYRNARMTKPALSRSDRHYLRKTTKWVDSIWVYFDTIEHDFRLLHMPMTIK